MNADPPTGDFLTDQPRIPSPHDQPNSTGTKVDQQDITFLGESSECIQIKIPVFSSNYYCMNSSSFVGSNSSSLSYPESNNS